MLLVRLNDLLLQTPLSLSPLTHENVSVHLSDNINIYSVCVRTFKRGVLHLSMCGKKHKCVCARKSLACVVVAYMMIL